MTCHAAVFGACVGVTPSLIVKRLYTLYSPPLAYLDKC